MIGYVGSLVGFCVKFGLHSDRWHYWGTVKENVYMSAYQVFIAELFSFQCLLDTKLLDFQTGKRKFKNTHFIEHRNSLH